MTAFTEHVVRSDELEIVVLPEVGGRIHRVRALGHDLLRTPDDPVQHLEDPFYWGAYVMAPWCNRAAAGSRGVAGRRVDLAANFPDGTAIHGLVSSAPWTVREGGDLVHRHEQDDGWPWPFEVAQRVAVAGRTLTLEYRLANLDSEAPMPAGIGLHPWFAHPLEVRIPAERVYATNVRSAPEPDAATGRFDLRRLARPPDGLDATWTSLIGGRLELAWPDRGIRAVLELETDTPPLLVAVASPAEVDAVAVEPQTHGPDPFRRLEYEEPDAPALLAAGESIGLRIRLSVEA